MLQARPHRQSARHDKAILISDSDQFISETRLLLSSSEAMNLLSLIRLGIDLGIFADGQRAVVEVIREFKYPTEFSAPQIPKREMRIRVRYLGLPGDPDIHLRFR